MLQLNDNQSTEFKLSYYGWVVVGASFLASLVGFGLVTSYGVFLKPLASEFGWSRSVIAGAFSTYAILHTGLAFFAGRFVDKFGPKLILGIGGFCLGFSMLGMSWLTSVFELHIYYGFILSVGVAAIYTPVLATVSRWFKAKRGLAVGIASSGFGGSSLVFSPLSAWLISAFGLRWSFMILGMVCWLIFIPVVILIRPVPRIMQVEIKSDSKEGLSFFEAFRTLTFWALCFSWMFMAVPLWAIMVHMVPLATDRGIFLLRAGVLAGLIGASSLIGRIGAGFLSDRFGRKRILIGSFVFELMITVWLLFSAETWMLYLFAIFFGISSGGWAGVIGVFPADYFGGKATGTILGFAILMAGVGVAIGPYLGGYIYDATQSYDYMIVMCIIATIAGIISALFLRPVKD